MGPFCKPRVFTRGYDYTNRRKNQTASIWCLPQSTEWDATIDESTEKCGAVFCGGQEQSPTAAYPINEYRRGIFLFWRASPATFLTSTNYCFFAMNVFCRYRVKAFHRKQVLFTRKNSWNAFIIMLQYILYNGIYSKKAADSRTRMILQAPFWNRWSENKAGMRPSGAEKDWIKWKTLEWAKPCRPWRGKASVWCWAYCCYCQPCSLWKLPQKPPL